MCSHINITFGKFWSVVSFSSVYCEAHCKRNRSMYIRNVCSSLEERYLTIGSKIADCYVLSWLYNIPCPQIQPQHSKDIIDTSSNRKRIES